MVSSSNPLGDHLSLLVFFIFVNDLIKIFYLCKALLFTDDLKIFMEVTSHKDPKLLQSDLNKFLD